MLDVAIARQPDDTTCGPTCLHAVYRFYGSPLTLEEVIESVPRLPVDGAARGTLAVMLGIDALRRGFRAALYTFNLQVFDPSWFDPKTGRASPASLIERLRAQAESKREFGARLAIATDAYVEFLTLGGGIRFRDLTSGLLAGFIRKGRPILTGLSATYLYHAPREYGPNDDPDDVRGLPAGHFVVLHGIDPRHRRVMVADPLEDNEPFASSKYEVPMSRLVPAIMLGVLTYDANLLIIEPSDETSEAEEQA